MTKSTNLKTRLWLAMGLMIALLAVVGLNSVVSNTKISKQTHNIENAAYPLAVNTTNLQLWVERSMATINTAATASREDLLEPLKEIETPLRESMRNVEALIANSPPLETKLSKIQSLYDSSRQVGIEWMYATLEEEWDIEPTLANKFNVLREELGSAIAELKEEGVEGFSESILTISKLTREVRTLTLIVFVIGFVSFIALTFQLYHSITRPVDDLLTVIQDIRGLETKFSKRVVIGSNDEIGQLGCAFNEMLDDLERSQRKVKEYTENLETKVRERTAELSENQKRLKTIWDTVKAGIVIIDAQSHKIVDANPLALSMLSATKEEVLGATCHRFICPSDKGKCPITDLGNKMDNSERRLVAHNGRLIPILKTAVTAELNGKPHLLESFIDISPLKKVQADLEEQNKRLQQAHEHIVQREKKLKDAQSQLVLSEKMASLGVLIAGIAHEINTPAGAIANVSSDLSAKIKTIINELINIHDLSHEELHLLGSFTEQFINGRFVAESGPQWKKSREIRKWLSELGVQNDKDVATILSKYNLLDKEQLAPYESLLKKQWAVNLMDAFGTVNVGIQICDSSIKKISEIVKALKYYAYTDMDKTSLVNINENIENVLLLMQNKLKYSFDVEKKFQSLPSTHCTSEISQVWTNLISNAHDAVVESKNRDEKGKIRIETRSQDDWITVQISDNGVGISPEDTTKMFDPFYTTKGIGKGTGLGLSIVSGIIKKHKGQISVDSMPGKTTFMVSLPINNGNGAAING